MPDPLPPEHAMTADWALGLLQRSLGSPEDPNHRAPTARALVAAAGAVQGQLRRGALDRLTRAWLWKLTSMLHLSLRRVQGPDGVAAPPDPHLHPVTDKRRADLRALLDHLGGVHPDHAGVVVQRTPLPDGWTEVGP